MWPLTEKLSNESMTHGHSLPKEISLSLAFQATRIGAYLLGKVNEECNPH